MNEQPEALRLADLIEWTTVQQDLMDAASELRRLHELNAELLVAVQGLLDALPSATTHPAIKAARAAIAKAEAQS